jgi:hypothetical protein
MHLEFQRIIVCDILNLKRGGFLVELCTFASSALFVSGAVMHLYHKTSVYPRTERGGSRGIYWPASACHPPFSRAPAPAAVLRPAMFQQAITSYHSRIVYNQ